MAKLNAKLALEKFKSTDNNDFFVLENDKQTAVVRFLYQSEEELDVYAVHEVQIAGKKRYVECLDDRCPMCQAGNRPTLKLFLQLVDDRDGKVKTWERGKTFIPKVLSYFAKYPNLAGRKFEIQRNGKKGSTETSYEFFPLDPDNVAFDTLPQKQELLAKDGFILVKTYEEMKAIVDGTSSEEQPQERQRQDTKNTDVF